MFNGERPRTIPVKERIPDKLIGVMAIAVFWTSDTFLGQREKIDKPWCDKQFGDLGLIMGTINETGGIVETVPQALARELTEEWGLESTDYVLDPHTYGYFPTEKGWVAVHVVMVRKERIIGSGKRFGPRDGETDCPAFLSVSDFDRFHSRGGVRDVVTAFTQGKRGFVLDACQGYRKNTVPFGDMMQWHSITL